MSQPAAQRKTYSDNQERKEPLIRIEARGDYSKKQAWTCRVIAIILAIIVGGLILLSIGQNPFNAYGTMLSGSLGKAYSIKQTIRITIPLLGTALAIAPAFKMRFWNIGAEGQITAGAIAATYFALFWYDAMPHTVLLITMAAAALIAGGIWGLIPAFFKAKWGTNETLFTLMLNYIIIGVVKYLQGGPWEKIPHGVQQIAQFDANAYLPALFGIHIGWIIVIILTALMFIYLKYSKHGYELSVMGESIPTARYAGMSVEWITMRTMILSGAIAGLMGFLVVSGADHTLSDSVAGGVGFTAITIAWLAQLNPIAMVFISFAMAILEKGASSLQTVYAVPASASDMLIGIILFFMLGCEFFIRYRLVRRKRNKQKEVE